MKQPIYALSIRQPWAWLIVNGYKDIENRDWPTSVQGPIWIHASKYKNVAEYGETVRWVKSILPDAPIPSIKEIELGGIVGTAKITGCVESSESPWFVGRFGFTLANAKRREFYPCAGRLGFFYLASADHPKLYGA